MNSLHKKLLVLLYWEKNTWYALGPLTASLIRNKIPYEVVRGDVTHTVETKINQGFSVVYGESSRNMSLNVQRKRLKHLVQTIPNTNLITVVGGPQATGDPGSFLEMGVDFVVVGEGEITFPLLVKSLIKNDFRREAVQDIPGISYRNGTGDTRRTKMPDRVNLDDYPCYSDNANFPLHPPIELMRGCAFRCKFCQVPYMYGNPRFRSIQNVVKIVRHYSDNFQFKDSVDIRFIAPNSLGYMEKRRGQANYLALKELIHQIGQFDIRLFLGTFPSEVRPEYITEETIGLFEDVANDHVSVGIQSGSARILSYMRRGHNVNVAWKAHDLITNHGITPVFDFILGNPTETEDEQWETIDLIRDLGKKAQVRLHHFMPLPWTPWKNAVPSPVYDSIQIEIGRLARDKIISGDFTKQSQYAEDV